MDTAHEIVAEEQEEATVGRQLEEIDEQMRAWSRVSDMEKRLVTVGEEVQEKKHLKPGEGPMEAESEVLTEPLEIQALNLTNKNR